jgi:hypothetical protein
MILKQSEIGVFNPEVHRLAIDYITNREQLELAKKELEYLTQTPEVLQYLSLIGMVADFEEELHEY